MSVYVNATQRRITERRKRVAQMVKQGLTERYIARELGVSRSTVWNDKQMAKVKR